MNYIGVDPGKNGAIILLSEDGKILEKHKTPLIRSTKAKDEYDIPMLVGILGSFKKDAHVILEKGQPIPLAGIMAQYQRGFSFGLYQGLFVGLGMPYTVVAPRTWQKAMFQDVNAEDTKAASILVAKRLWPREDWRRTERSKLDDDGFTDAALLAMFGLRTYNGGREVPGMQ